MMAEAGIETPSYASWARIAAMLRRESRFIESIIFVAVAFAVLVPLVRQRTYSMSGSFVAQQRGRATPQMAGIASQLGLPIGSADGQQSVDFFVDLVLSRETLRRVVDSSFHLSVAGKAAQITIPELLGISDANPDLQRERTVDAITHLVNATGVTKTGLVRIDVRTPWPELSEALATRMIAAVDSFNIRTGQNRAVAEARFSNQRLTESRGRLREAEEAYRVFLEQNRSIHGSPGLQVENNRLERAITAQQQITTFLQQVYEDARIDAVRNTPSIAVVERPILPVRPDSRGILVRSVVALLLSAVLGTCLALAREMMATQSERD